MAIKPLPLHVLCAASALLGGGLASLPAAAQYYNTVRQNLLRMKMMKHIYVPTPLARSSLRPCNVLLIQMSVELD
jgi:hypothetical protein